MDRNLLNGQTLNKRWGVHAKHALYRRTGDWYHVLNGFPGALFDASGYLLFETYEDYILCPYLKIRQHINVPEGIMSIPGYARVVVDGKENLHSTAERTYYEGSAIQVVMSKYERNPAARLACIKHYGLQCTICGMSFYDRYGPKTKDIIHVHHLKPLGGADAMRIVDPIRDLRPVCPNCHAVLHSRRPVFSIEEVKEMLAMRIV